MTMMLALGTLTPTSTTVVATRTETSPSTKACMTASFSAAGIWPWTRPTLGPMAWRRRGGALLGVAQVDLVGLRDQRADPEGLGPGLGGGPSAGR
jgi:hypothetical protein